MIMNYRDYGNTGDRISALGFGCMRLPEIEKDGNWSVDEDKAIPMLLKAYEEGVNYFDTAPYYLHSNSEIAVGHAAKQMDRDKILISTKIPADEIKESGDYRRFLERSLKKLDQEYIDYYHFWGLSKEKFDNYVLKYDLLKEAVRAKEEGLIRHISFSFHDAPENIKYIIDTAQVMESMLVQYNLLDRRNEEMIAYARKCGLGVAVMGPVGGGRLAMPLELMEKIGKSHYATYELAFKFVLGNPNVCCALSGMGSMEMVEQNVKVAGTDAGLSEEEWSQITEAVENLMKFNELYCTGCSYCQPCPAGIKIPDIFTMYTHYNVYGLKEHALKQMKNYAEQGGKLLDACKNCGLCEKKCPQKLKIREKLKETQDLLCAQS